MGQRGEGGTGGFGQTVGLQNVDAEGVEVVSDLGIEARAAGDQVAHAVAEGAVQLAEEDAAGIESHAAQTAVERHQGLQRPARQLGRAWLLP